MFIFPTLSYCPKGSSDVVSDLVYDVISDVVYDVASDAMETDVYGPLLRKSSHNVQTSVTCYDRRREELLSILDDKVRSVIASLQFRSAHRP